MTNDDDHQDLAYKVVELATVDEAALEQAVNTWVHRGWRLENVQFAMRESSRRPSMAFVFFTRTVPAEGAPEAADRPDHVPSDREEGLARLRRLSEQGPTLQRATSDRGVDAPGLAVSPHERLRQLAGEDDGGGEGA